MLSISMHMQNLVKIHLSFLKILSGKENIGTDRRMDGQPENSIPPPHTKYGGIMMPIWSQKAKICLSRIQYCYKTAFLRRLVTELRVTIVSQNDYCNTITIAEIPIAILRLLLLLQGAIAITIGDSFFYLETLLFWFKILFVLFIPSWKALFNDLFHTVHSKTQENRENILEFFLWNLYFLIHMYSFYHFS